MFRRYARTLELCSMLLMLAGVAALCQPWIKVLHSYSATTIIAGLVMFNIFSRIGSPKTRAAAQTVAPPAH